MPRTSSRALPLRQGVTRRNLGGCPDACRLLAVFRQFRRMCPSFVIFGYRRDDDPVHLQALMDHSKARSWKTPPVTRRRVDAEGRLRPVGGWQRGRAVRRGSGRLGEEQDERARADGQLAARADVGPVMRAGRLACAGHVSRAGCATGAGGATGASRMGLCGVGAEVEGVGTTPGMPLVSIAVPGRAAGAHHRHRAARQSSGERPHLHHAKLGPAQAQPRRAIGAKGSCGASRSPIPVDMVRRVKK